MHITVPEGEHPVIWSTRSVGSPKLCRNQAASFDAAYYNDSDLTPRERELVRQRSALDSGCPLCIGTRAGVDKPGFSDQEIPADIYEHVLEYRTWPGYTERERLVIEFCERYIYNYRDLARDKDLWARLKDVFSEPELGDLCMLCGHWDATTKMFHLLLGLDQFEPPAQAAG